MPYCSDCGEYTTRRGPFAEALCAECHQRQDDGIEAVEQRDANKHGYDQEYYRRLRQPAVSTAQINAK